MTSFDYKYQNVLRQAIVFSIFSFVKNRSCVTQICITKIAAKCILVVVVKWRRRADVLLGSQGFCFYFVQTVINIGYILHKKYTVDSKMNIGSYFYKVDHDNRRTSVDLHRRNK